jgi:endonuclease G
LKDAINFDLSFLLYLTMPGIGPSLVFAAGLAIGVGAGTLLPKKGKSDAGILPPPPVEKYDVVKRVPTAGGSAVLQGGFPGTYTSYIHRCNG